MDPTGLTLTFSSSVILSRSAVVIAGQVWRTWSNNLPVLCLFDRKLLVTNDQRIVSVTLKHRCYWWANDYILVSLFCFRKLASVETTNFSRRRSGLATRRTVFCAFRRTKSDDSWQDAAACGAFMFPTWLCRWAGSVVLLLSTVLYFLEGIYDKRVWPAYFSVRIMCALQILITLRFCSCLVAVPTCRFFVGWRLDCCFTDHPWGRWDSFTCLATRFLLAVFFQSTDVICYVTDLNNYIVEHIVEPLIF